jgi:hypothetical protein
VSTQPTPGTQNGNFQNGKYENGKFEAPHFLNGASNNSQPPTAPSQERTVFPPDPAHSDLRRPAYLLDQFLFFGAPLRRHLVFLLAAMAGIAALGVLPGRWWTAGILLALAVGITLYVRAWRKRDFVEFHAKTAPQPTPQQLEPKDKISVHVTGYFTVEGKYKRFSQLPGYYRTFATREHALLCLIRDRSVFRLGRWPEEDIGMWYIFFRPELIQRIEWGELSFGPDTTTSIAVTYMLTVSPLDQEHKEFTVEETVYISAESESETVRILADLLYEVPDATQPKRELATEASR